MSKKIKSIKIIDPGSPPDVDTDFSTVGKGKVFEYVKEKYGSENVASIITPGPFKNKNAFKSMATIHSVPFANANKISQLIPDGSDGTTIKDLIDKDSPKYNQGKDLRTEVANAKLDDVLKFAADLNGRARETGVHACGILISPKVLTDSIPMQVRDDDQMPVTQWNYYDCEALGLIKMDFLGLNTVDIIDTSVKYIKDLKGIELDMEEIIEGDLDDEDVYKMFQEGNTETIFQFSGEGVQTLLKDVKPNKFEDLAAITALYRPGPMGLNLHHEYAERKNNPEARIPVHKDFYGTELEKILEPTYGSLVYQEQVMEISKRCAGFDAKGADKLRKAIGKKNAKLMASLEDKFKKGMLENGYTKESVDVLWSGIVDFGSYAFNKCLKYSTGVYLPNNKRISVKELYSQWKENPEDTYILSMFPDGEIKPHKVSKVVYTGKKPVYKVKTKSGRFIEITEEHRMLSNEGYVSIAEGSLKVGAVLLHDTLNTHITQKPIEKTRKTTDEDGFVYDSILKYTVGQYLKSRNIEFELHKELVGIKSDKIWCDFYTNGLYFEVDELNKGRDYFVKNKYGKDIPFIYLTQSNYMDVIDEAIMNYHIKNGDEVVEILPMTDYHPYTKTTDTYDIEMDITGPSNFIANGLVSHNSHSISYALNSYQCAFLKVHYPVEYMTAVLNERIKDDKTSAVIKEADRMGISITLPDINFTNEFLTPIPEKMQISYGFRSVKGLGAQAIKDIIEERNKNGLYKDLKDFIQRNKNSLTKTTLITLAKVGSFDSFGISRKAIIEDADNIIKTYTKLEKINSSTGSLFDLMGAEETGVDLDYKFIEDEYDFLELVNLEASVTDLYLSKNPIDNILDKNGEPVHKSQLSLNNPKVDGYQYVSFLTMKKGKNRSGQTIYNVTLDNKISQVNMNLPVKITRAIALYEALEKTNNDRNLAYEYLKLSPSEIAQYEDVEPIKPLELYKPYKLTFKHSKYANRSFIESLEPVDLNKEGFLLNKAILRTNDHNKFVGTVNKIEAWAKNILKTENNHSELRIYTMNMEMYRDLKVPSDISILYNEVNKTKRILMQME